MSYIVLFFLLIIGAVLVFCTSRTAQLKYMARTLHLRYDPVVDNPLTPLSAQAVHLFNHSFLQFKQVLTWREPGMFIRLCQACVRAPIQTTTQHYTLASVELTRGNFTPFILQPCMQKEKPAHPALPPELTQRFTLNAPATFQFSQEIIGLLKATTTCYLEASAYALVYHTYQQIPVSQLQTMRWRAQQFAKELFHEEPLPSKTPATASSSVESQVETLLKLHASPSANKTPSNGMKLFYLVVGLAFLMGLLWMAQYYLRQLAH